MQDIEQSVLKEAIGGLCLDTSIFKSEGLSLKNGRLGLLRQFRHGQIRLVIPDIILSEVRKHLIDKYEKTIQGIDSSINALMRTSCISKAVVDEARERLIGNNTPTTFTDEEIEWFDNETNFEEIKSDQYPILKELTYRYINTFPPFENKSDKKHEFPDAIALLALEHWASENDTKIIVVSRDKGWELFCEHSKHLLYTEDLESALKVINSRNAYADKIQQFVEAQLRDTTSDLYASITKKIRRCIEELEVEEDYSSYFDIEADYTEIEVHDVAIDIGDNQIFGAFVTAMDEDYATIEVMLTSGVSFSCSFSLSKWDSIDRESISLGSANVKVDDDLNLTALISFWGDIKQPENMKLTNVELTDTYIRVNFGDVEPGWMHDDYDFA